MTPPRRLGLRVPHQGWNIHRPCFGESQTLCLKAAEEYARNRVVERPLVFVRRVLTVSDADRLKSARLDDSFDIRAKRFVTALPVDHHVRRATNTARRPEPGIHAPSADSDFRAQLRRRRTHEVSHPLRSDNQ